MSSTMQHHLRLMAVAVALVAATACQDRSTVASPTGLKPSHSISDGAHGGNGDVFFLPPIVADPSGSPGYGDPFQPGLPVAFRICVVEAAACAQQVRYFGPEAVTQSITDQDYQANWDTKVDNLDPSLTYRLEVRIGSRVVAFADVDVVSSGSQLRNVQTGQYIALLDGRTLPIKVRVEQGWNCANHESCVTQLVTNSPPAGQTYTVVTSSDGENAAAFPANWFDPAAAGTSQVLVTIEDVTQQLNPNGGTEGCAIGKTVMLTGGHCVRFTTDPKVTFTAEVHVAVCEVGDETDHRQLLLKYDTDETPTFLRNVPPPIVCPEHHTVGSTKRAGVMGHLASALSRLGGAVHRLVGPRPAYAFDMGVGGAIYAGDGFSLIASGLPVTMTAVAGDGQAAGPGATLGVAPQVRLVTPHPVPAPLAGVQVVCTVTAGGGSLGGAPSATVTTDATGLATCPAWTLGTATGTNSVHITSPHVDEVVRMGAIVNDVPAIVSSTGALTFSATATTGSQVSGTVYYSTTPLAGIRVDLIPGTNPSQPPLQTATTTTGGGYTFGGVPAGAYTVKVYGGGEYILWTGRGVSVNGNVVQDMYLPKNLALLSPDNRAVLTTTPTLMWASNPEAAQYRLQVNRTNNWDLVAWPLLNGTSYTLNTPLMPLLPNTNYTWQVDAYDANNHEVGSSASSYYWSFTTASIVVDGVMSPGEWDGATQIPLTLSVPGGGNTPATMYITNDGTNFYFALSFPRAALDPGNNNFHIQFDSGDWLSAFPPNLFQDGWYVNGSLTLDNQTNGAAAFRSDGTTSIYEMSHPLNSGDPLDIAAAPGQTVSLYMAASIGNVGNLYPLTGYFPYTVR